jgi:hypothetical protein
VAEAQPTLTLRAVLGAADIGEGFHTLTVSLATGNKSSRMSQSVAFYVGASATAPRVPGGGRLPIGKLPVRPVIPADHLAPALKPLAPKPPIRIAGAGAPPPPSPRIVRRIAKETLARTSEALVGEAAAKSAHARTIRDGVKARPLRVQRIALSPIKREGDPR